MNDYYVSAADAAILRAALIEAGVAIELEGELILGEGVMLDIIGFMYDSAADPEMEPQPLPGYHTNIRSEQPITWPRSITEHQPETPWRTWA